MINDLNYLINQLDELTINKNGFERFKSNDTMVSVNNLQVIVKKMKSLMEKEANREHQERSGFGRRLSDQIKIETNGIPILQDMAS